MRRKERKRKKKNEGKGKIRNEENELGVSFKYHGSGRKSRKVNNDKKRNEKGIGKMKKK